MRITSFNSNPVQSVGVRVLGFIGLRKIRGLLLASGKDPSQAPAASKVVFIGFRI